MTLREQSHTNTAIHVYTYIFIHIHRSRTCFGLEQHTKAKTNNIIYGLSTKRIAAEERESAKERESKGAKNHKGGKESIQKE